MKKFLLYFLIVLVVIQFYRPKKNQRSVASENHISTVVEVPDAVQLILDRSCNDCHSNNSNYAWYHNIAPFSYVVANHIKEGKEHLNFDEWAAYNSDQLKHIIGDFSETIETREMPLVGYLKFHPEAVISDDDNQKLLDWIATLDNK